ncbi:GAF and ANTAR domain-containing protein [soil metagenome]
MITRDRVISAQLHQILVDMPTLSAYLDEVARLAVHAAEPTVSCGITVRSPRGPYTVSSSDPLSAELDEDQYGNGDGPCIQALREGVEIYVADFNDERRWGQYPVRATALGVHGSLSLPLMVGGESLGAVNFYSLLARPYDEACRAELRVFAGTVSGALGIAVRMADQLTLTEQLRAALTSRTVIDQALGILMAREQCDAASAFGQLRTSSQQQNIKLRVLAGRLVTGVSEQSLPPERSAV